MAELDVTRWGNMRILRAVVFVVIIIVSWIEPAESGWYTYTATDGLVDNHVQAMLEDTSGNLWFGTQMGISRYDGATWHTFVASEAPYGPGVEAIFQDHLGRLWFGRSNAGATCYDGTSWRTYTRSDGLVHNEVRAIEEDRNGDLWFGTYSGVSRYDGVNWRTYTMADGLADNWVMAITEDRTGTLWFGTYGGGVSRYDGVSWASFTSSDGLADDYVLAILEDSSGNLWFATDGGGVSRYDGTSWHNYTYSDGLACNMVYSICEDDEGRLWFATYCGVSRFDGATWETYTRSDGLPSNYVSAVIEDRSGNIWVGTFETGAGRYDKTGWRSYTAAEGLPSNSVLGGLVDSEGNLWFITNWGVTRYDGISWRTFGPEDGLGSYNVTSILQDHSGRFWFGTRDSGVSCYDGVSWRTYTVADGLPTNSVSSLLEDSAGRLWVGTSVGVSCYYGTSWMTYTYADGLASNTVYALAEDSSGRLWVGTNAGVSCYDGVTWRTYKTADGLLHNSVSLILRDHLGNLWFGTVLGVNKYDGISWHSYTTADGLIGNWVTAICEDRSGNLWFATYDGVSRYDRSDWGNLTITDGLASHIIYEILEDHSGRLWFTFHESGVQRYEPDRIAPRAMIFPRPPSVSTSVDQTITFIAALREVEGVNFSWSFDEGPWSPWSPSTFWQGGNLPEGSHVFRVRARDRIGNVSVTPGECVFEIDATPPPAVILSPVSGQAVRGIVAIVGTAADSRFSSYRLDFRAAGSDYWQHLVDALEPTGRDTIAAWDTEQLQDGSYELRLSVADTLGLVGITTVEVEVDNQAPWAYETSPVVVRAAGGGDVYTTNGEVHLYFPPRAFSEDTEVEIEALTGSAVPDSLVNGAVRVQAGYEISWRGAVLHKPATLEVSYAGVKLGESAASVDSLLVDACQSLRPLPPPGGSYRQLQESPGEGVLVLYKSVADSVWTRVGGTIDEQSILVSVPVTEPGQYALFVEPPGTETFGLGTLSAISLTPRVFSPHGTFANDHVAIGFTLGRSAPVTVKVYNRAGRLVRKVIAGEVMGAGANLVRWDGSDRDGGVAEDGLYLITVEALGQKQVKTVAVVR